jgi:hypothetical protein
MTAEPLPLALAVRRPPWSDRMVVTDAGSTYFETEKLKALPRKVAARTIEGIFRENFFKRVGKFAIEHRDVGAFTHRRLRLCDCRLLGSQRLKQRLRLLQIARVEALREPP